MPTSHTEYLHGEYVGEGWRYHGGGYVGGPAVGKPTAAGLRNSAAWAMNAAMPRLRERRESNVECWP